MGVIALFFTTSIVMLVPTWKILHPRHMMRLVGTSRLARHLPVSAARRLSPGALHYTAYVGPPQEYDFMGATQFRLLCTLGLRDYHRVLDFGCGSLRAGRLLIPYLRRGQYYGLEPNQWLVDDAITSEIGRDLVRIKRPNFFHNDDFTTSSIGVLFDFILAQSIFSHTGRDLIAKCLAEFARSTTQTGLVLATFVHDATRDFSGRGWVYPECTAYTSASIAEMIGESGLVGVGIPWFHPRQRWYVMAKSYDRLPRPEHLKHLSGAVLFDPGFSDSVV